MDRKELIKKYMQFFESKGHTRIRNSSLIPENDPTVLFTTAGMHPLVPYLLGQKHPQGKRLVNVQACVRTGDIEEVGDEVHHTFFEMLGNWSLRDYWKKEAIEMTYEFLTKELGISKDRLAVSVFGGDEDVSKDSESVEVWKSLGIDESRIAYLGREDNWWGPAGKTGPCGVDTEVFYCTGSEEVPEKFDVEDKRWVEIGNNVLMGYVKDSGGKYLEAEQKNVDFGGGVERIVAVLNNLEDNYMADMWKPIIEKIEELSGKKYFDYKKEMRIIADHVKASVFIISNGVVPGNSEQGYVLRRLIRRVVRFGRMLGLENFVSKVAEPVYEIYNDYDFDKGQISKELDKEEERFLKTLERGMRLFEKVAKDKKRIDGKDAFLLYQSYGFPIEMTVEIAKENGLDVDVEGFEAELKKHQELSRTASAGKFKSGLADNSEATTKLHTATHLLHEALNRVLGGGIEQRGSNTTSERLRFDFSFDRKLTDEEKQKIEDIVNEKIGEEIPVTMKEMTLEEAKKIGARGVFEDKYGDKVKVYSIGDFSCEICGGPHVENTRELGTFKIKKETSSSSGVRRIKAVLV